MQEENSQHLPYNLIKAESSHLYTVYIGYRKERVYTVHITLYRQKVLICIQSIYDAGRMQSTQCIQSCIWEVGFICTIERRICILSIQDTVRKQSTQTVIGYKKETVYTIHITLYREKVLICI